MAPMMRMSAHSAWPRSDSCTCPSCACCCTASTLTLSNSRRQALFANLTVGLSALQCLKLADLIADEASGLANIMQGDKNTLRALLLCMRAAALKNLERGRDAFGSH